jgi:hypothetical protein
MGAGVGELSGLRWGIPWALIGLRTLGRASELRKRMLAELIELR